MVWRCKDHRENKLVCVETGWSNFKEREAKASLDGGKRSILCVASLRLWN